MLFKQQQHYDYARALVYRAFRTKWDVSMPLNYSGLAPINLTKLRTIAAPSTGQFQLNIQPDPSICEIRP